MELLPAHDAKEVLFHLNYMGYRNVSKEHLKYFMTDLKKLIKFESQEASPRRLTEAHFQVEPASINVQRLFESHTVTSRKKLKEKSSEKNIPSEKNKVASKKSQPQMQPNSQKTLQKTTQQNIDRLKQLPCKQPVQQIPNIQHSQQQETLNLHTIKHRSRTSCYKETADPVVDHKETRAKSADVLCKTRNDMIVKSLTDIKNPSAINKRRTSVEEKSVPSQPLKSKMWIRPRSGSHANRNDPKKTDPVALYQAYQKEWQKFKSNICESSHSDLRWAIREKMMGNN